MKSPSAHSPFRNSLIFNQLIGYGATQLNQKFGSYFKYAKIIELETQLLQRAYNQFFANLVSWREKKIILAYQS